MLYSRWLALGVFIILLFLITYYDKDKWKNKLRYYSLVLLEGMVGGFIIDCIGISAGYYYFPRQPFLSLEYYLIVIPCWGVFGLLINCLWKWVGKERFWLGMVVTLFPLFAFYEGMNVLTNSWNYTVPFYYVIIGWIPLIWTFAGCNRRRRVIFKIEEWQYELNVNKVSHRIAYYLLWSVRIVLIIIMFPILLSLVIRLCCEIPALIKRNVNIMGYAKVLLLME